MVPYYGLYANAHRGKVRKAIRRRRLPPVGIWVVDTSPRPGSSYFVRGRVDLEREAGDFEPGEKRNFLSDWKSEVQVLYRPPFLYPKRRPSVTPLIAQGDGGIHKLNQGLERPFDMIRASPSS